MGKEKFADVAEIYFDGIVAFDDASGSVDWNIASIVLVSGRLL